MNINAIRNCLLKHVKDEGETRMEASRLVVVLSKCGFMENVSQAVDSALKAGIISTKDQGASYTINL